MASSKNKIKVLFASPEVMPFASTGGLGEVAGSLPKALVNDKDSGIDCRVIAPLYEKVPADVRKKMKFLGHIDVPVAWRNQYMGIFELKQDGTIYYFVDNEYYFKRRELYGHYDDGERFAYFSRAVLESSKVTGFQPDVIHANDWQTALAPVYRNTIYKHDGVKTVFTVHNIEYQGKYGLSANKDFIGLPKKDAYVIEYGDAVNLMKGAIDSCDKFTTVSETYARELAYPESAFGLHEVIRANQHKMIGILNGIDTDAYDPSKDAYLNTHFSSKDLRGKFRAKQALQKMLALPKKNVPLITMVSRLVAPKGADLLMGMLENVIANNDVQFVMLGTGDMKYEEFFRGLEAAHRDKVRSIIDFNTGVAHKIYAAGDILLMPSRSEPCGLAQMIGCRYGDIPIVRQTGGLADSIHEWNGKEGEGFTFYDFTPQELERAVYRALALKADDRAWKKLVRNAMNTDFSWSRSAKEYSKMYHELMGR